MGVCEFSSIYKIFNQIVKEAVGGQSTVLILTSQQVDSLAATKILSTLLAADCLPHSIKPIQGYDYLAKTNESLLADNDVLKSIVMINCGGLVNVQDFLTLSPSMHVYIMDSHRPINLQNIFAADQVTVLDDGTIKDLDEVKSAYETLLMLEQEEDDDEDDYDSDEEEDEEEEPEEENQEDDGEQDETKSITSQTSTLDGDNQENDQEGNKRKQQSPTKKPPKKPKHNPMSVQDVDARVQSAKKKRIEKRNLLLKNQNIIKDYYSEGTYLGMSASELMYSMASQLGKGSNDILWLAVIGLTDQYISSKIDYTKYLTCVEEYKTEVLRYTIAPDIDDEPNLYKKPTENGIVMVDEFRFMLYRHWNLQDSMFHSPYVAAKMGFWKEKGKKRLAEMLAKMGFPKKECTQPYSAMPIKYKKTIHEKLVAIAPMYNMPEIIFPSFVRTYGFITALSASDVVYALDSLVDSAGLWIGKFSSGQLPIDLHTKVESSSDHIVGRGGGENVQQGIGVGTKTGVAGVSSRLTDLVLDPKDAKWEDNFWYAYDALESIDLLNYGIHLSMQIQSTLVQTGIQLFDRKAIRELSAFRFVILSSIEEYPIFARSPTHLAALANFLLDGYKSYHPKRLPMVIAAVTEAGNYLVVGVNSTGNVGQIKKNVFGLAFQTTAERTESHIKHDFFDTSVVEVRKEDILPFIDRLNKVLSNDDDDDENE